MFKKISSKETYWGEVVDVNDPLKAGRIRVRVFTVFDEIPTEAIPWAESNNTYDATIKHDLPELGSIVFVQFPYDVPYSPMWTRKRSKYNGDITNEDYPSATILLEKDLSKYNLDGNVRISYTESEGILLELTKNDTKSFFIIRPDNTIIATNNKSKQSIHIAEDNISIGREDKSQQPATVGDDNVIALQKLNKEIKTLSELMDGHLNKLSKVCKSNAILMPLSPIFKAYGADVKKQIKKIFEANEDFFPETLSKVVTVDKEKPE